MSPTLPRSRRPLALAIALTLGTNFAHAATVTVTNVGDVSDPGYCTLRQAISVIASANTYTTFCSNSGDAFGTEDTIVFDDSLKAATITLAQGQLAVSGLTAPLTIQGSGQTIDANKLSRVLYAKSATLTVSGLTLTHGKDPTRGGGVYALSSTVTLTNSTVHDNNGGNDGGGVDATHSTVTLTSSTVSRNSAFRGGAVYAAYSAFHVTDSAFFFNYVHDGGGMAAFNSTLSLTNSTVFRNYANHWGGAAILIASTLVLATSTVTGNYAAGFGGGVFAADGSTLDLYGTIMSHNELGNPPAGCFIIPIYCGGDHGPGNVQLVGSPASTVVAKYSLLGTPLNPSFYSNLSGNGNIFSDDPLLGPLANNGGPTMTIALAATSPAINTGKPALAIDLTTGAPLHYDQRGPGFPRFLPAGMVDIGAYQHQGTNRIFTDGFESGP